MSRFFPILLAAGISSIAITPSYAQDAKLKLPNPLVTAKGERIYTLEGWMLRRPEVLELFRTNIYGRAPIGRPEGLRFEVVETEPKAMDGKATRKQVKIHYRGAGGEGAINLVLFTPNEAPKPAPCLLLICNRPAGKNIDPTRANKSPFWPAEAMIARGYAAAAFYNGDVVPDKHDDFRSGVFAIFDRQPRAVDAWGAIAAWAWGASRVMDYLETDPAIDAKKVGVIGHSRGGKTALWAGAEDERFAFVVSNNSGSTGAALARGKTGERIANINKGFPHWLNQNYKAFANREEELPVDQHMLLGLIAPRLLYVASATEDAWAHPKNEYLSTVAASLVYAVFRLKGIGDSEVAPDSPIQEGHIGYHLRTGKHDLTEYDWARFMDFSDRHWKVGAKEENKK